MRDVYDGPWKLFSFDPSTGRTVWSQWIDGKFTLRIDTPVDNIIRSNSQDRNGDHPHRFGEFVRVASVPLNEFHYSGLAEASAQGDDKHLSRWLNDSDNAAWRTRDGRF